MNITTFFGEEKLCVSARDGYIEWYSSLLIALPSQHCIDYCGSHSYDGEALPLFEDLLMETSKRTFERTDKIDIITTSILHVRDVEILKYLANTGHRVVVKYPGSRTFYVSNKKVLDYLLLQPFIHIKEI